MSKGLQKFIIILMLVILLGASLASIIIYMIG